MTRPTALCLPVALLALATGAPQAIQGGTPTTAFKAVGVMGVQRTADWVLTAQHAAVNAGSFFGNGYGLRVVAARYDAPGSGAFPANDLSLLRLQQLVASSFAFHLRGGGSAGGLFLGHVLVSSALLPDERGQPLGSAFVRPAAYRSWIDSVLAGDIADNQAVLWVSTPVPEPALLLAAGIAALAWRRRHA